MGAMWLNLAGKLILINVVMDAFPVFTCSISLAPKSIIQEIEKEFRCFFMAGRKARQIQENASH